MTDNLRALWVPGAKVVEETRWHGFGTIRIVTKVTAAGNAALDGGFVEWRIDTDGEGASKRRGTGNWPADSPSVRVLLLTPEVEARIAEQHRVEARKDRAYKAIKRLEAAWSDPDSIPDAVLDAFDAWEGGE